MYIFLDAHMLLNDRGKNQRIIKTDMLTLDLEWFYIIVFISPVASCNNIYCHVTFLGFHHDNQPNSLDREYPVTLGS